MLEAISNGMFHASMKEKMDTLEARKAELDTNWPPSPRTSQSSSTLPLLRSIARRSKP